MSDFNFSEFIAMGGYAKYVWSSWALTIIAFAGLIISAIHKRKSVYKNYQKQTLQAAAREKRANKQLLQNESQSES